jgi:hypothetical protein
MDIKKLIFIFMQILFLNTFFKNIIFISNTKKYYVEPKNQSQEKKKFEKIILISKKILLYIKHILYKIYEKLKFFISTDVEFRNCILLGLFIMYFYYIIKNS